MSSSEEDEEETTVELEEEEEDAAVGARDDNGGGSRVTYGVTGLRNRKAQGRLFGDVRTSTTEQSAGKPRRHGKSKSKKTMESLGSKDTLKTLTDSNGTARSGFTQLSVEEDGEYLAVDPEYAKEYLEELKTELALELEINKLELLASLVPARIIRYHMRNAQSMKVFSEKFLAATLFADISGFSNLAERLVKEISHEAYAAENLSRYIGASLEQMVAAICTKGGDVVKFAGDAILAIFPAESFGNRLEEATACACQVAMELVSFDFRVAGASAIKLSVHCGVGCGEIVSYNVGGFRNRWEYVVTGGPVEQIGTAEGLAEAGQTVVSQETWELLGDVLVGEPIIKSDTESGFLLKDVKKPLYKMKDLISVEMERFTSENPIQYKRLQSLLHCYVPQPALVSIEGGNGIWSGELRVCSTVFCRLLELNYEGTEEDLNTIQHAFQIVHESIAMYEGTLLRFIVDDKGAGILSAFGLPPLKHENDAVRAIKAAMNIHLELGDLEKYSRNWRVTCSIGITTGEVFCGTVGGPLRCEYTLHGVKVNLAARLMVAAQHGIYCDEQTQKESAKYIKFGSAREIRVKGRQKKVRVYRPKKQKLVVSIDQKHNFEQTGRRKEEDAVKEMLSRVLNPKHRNPGVLIITGDAGMGKTRLCQYAMERMKKQPWVTLFARGDDTESQNSFYIWRSLFSQLMQTFVGDRKIVHLDESERMQVLHSRLPTIDEVGLERKRNSLRNRPMSAGDWDEDGTSGSLRESKGRPASFDGRRMDRKWDDDEKISPDDNEEQRYTDLSADSDAADAPEVVRELAPLLQRIVPDFFNLGRSKDKTRGLSTNSTLESGPITARLMKLIIEIFVKAVRDLEHAGRFFDTEYRGIAKNKNVVRICIIVENVQWIDQHSMEVLYRLAERLEPMAIIVTARENLFPALRTLAGNTIGDWYSKFCEMVLSTKLDLKPLKEKDMRKCIMQWTNTASVGSTLLKVVMDKSGGQPFFAFELINLMLETDLIVINRDKGVCDVPKDIKAKDLGLPSTISSLMTSRIDRIAPNLQLTLKVASVIGSEFQTHVLASVLLSYTGVDDQDEPILEENRNQDKMYTMLRNDGEEDEDEEEVPERTSTHSTGGRRTGSNKSTAVEAAAAAGDLREISALLDDNIQQLIDRGFLERREDSDGVGESNFIRFSSVMLRESAYGLLLFKMRKALHVKVAEFFEEKYSDYLQPWFVLLAQHYFVAEAVDPAIYYLEIAGDDALETHTMDHVWICFTRLQRMVDGYKRQISAWKRASWHRKIAEAYMYFMRLDAAEEELRQGLKLLELDVTTSAFIGGDESFSDGSSHSHPTKSAAVGQSESTQGAEDHLKHEKRLLTTHRTSAYMSGGNELTSSLAQARSVATAELSGADRDARGLISNPDSLMSAQDAFAHRSEFRFHNKMRQSTLRRQSKHGMRRQTATTNDDVPLEELLNAEEESEKAKQRGFFQRVFREHSRKKQMKKRQEFVQKTMKSYKRVEERRMYAKTLKDAFSNVECFLEASKIYQLLASLVVDQSDPVGLERRFNSMTLAKAAYKCASKRSEGFAERMFNGDPEDGKSKVLLDLNDHRLENRSLDSCAAALDQLALTYSGQALFFASMYSKGWARKISEEYADKASRLLPNVRSSSSKGMIAQNLGEYALLLGDHMLSEHHLRRASWIFSFLRFSKERIESTELLIIHQLFVSRDLRHLELLAIDLWREGKGMACVHALCGFLSVVMSDFKRTTSILSMEMKQNLCFLSEQDTPETRLRLQTISDEIRGEIDTVEDPVTPLEKLAVLSMLMLRGYGKCELALMIAHQCAKMVPDLLSLDNLSIVSFHVLVGLFEVFMDSFTSEFEFDRSRKIPTEEQQEQPYRPVLVSGRSSRRLDQVDKSVDINTVSRTPQVVVKRESSNGNLSAGNHASVSLSETTMSVTSTSAALTSATSSKSLIPASSKSPKKKAAGGLPSPQRKLEVIEYEKTQVMHRRMEQELSSFWRGTSSAKLLRKRAMPHLEALLDIVTNYADLFEICRPFATYCAAVLSVVKSGRPTARSNLLFEKCAEQAHDTEQLRLKSIALLEIGISNKQKVIFEKLIPKFAKLHDHYNWQKAQWMLLKVRK